MPCAMAMGQAAGVASVLSVQEAVTLSQIDVKKLQNILLEKGAILD